MIKKQLPYFVIVSLSYLLVTGSLFAETNNWQQYPSGYQNNNANSDFYQNTYNQNRGQSSQGWENQNRGQSSQGWENQNNQQRSARMDNSQPGFTAINSNSLNSIFTVRSRPMGSTVKLGGTVVPYKDVTLSAQIPGRIEFIAGSEGDFIEKGKDLVSIDDDDLLAQRRAALAELSNADAAIRNAQVQYSRELISPNSRNINRSPGMGLPSMFDQFFTRNMGSQLGVGNPGMDRHADLYSQATQVNQAQSRLLAVRSQLEEVDAKLRDARSVAPFSGLIVKKMVEVGDTVQPGQPLLHFADTKDLQLEVDIPARLMPGIQQGMVVDARLDVGDKRIQAKVAQIYPMADVQRHTVTVKFDLPPGIPGGPGMYAEVIIPNVSAPARQVTVIPASAVRKRGSLNVVYRMNEKNDVEIRYVRLGEKMNEDWVSVLSGLSDGERILTDPPANIQSGWSPQKSGYQSNN